MRNLEFSGMYGLEYITLKQVSKPTAKKLFNSGQRVFLQSSNFLPFGVWSTALELNNAYGFTIATNEFERYNCINSQTGKYVTYYKVL